MSAYDLTTEKGMVAWLETLPEDQRRDAACVLVARLVGRAIPWMSDQWGDLPREIYLENLRATLTMVLAVQNQSADVTAAGKNAARNCHRFISLHTLLGTVDDDEYVPVLQKMQVSGFGIAQFVSANLEGRNAFFKDTKAVRERGVEYVRTAPLWALGKLPHQYDTRWATCMETMTKDTADWSFWIDWYQGWLKGQLPSRGLSQEVATNQEIDWTDPIAANAKIVEIWKRHQANAAPKPPDPDDLKPQRRAALREQVAFLLKTSDATSLTTRALSQQIKIAIDDWCNEQRCNQLPEDLAVFGQMQTTLAGIADTLEDPAPESDKITALEVRVLELEAENKALLAKVNAATKSPDRHPFVLEFHKTMGKLTAGAIYGGTGYIVAQYIGPEQVQALAQAGRALLEAVKPPHTP